MIGKHNQATTEAAAAANVVLPEAGKRNVLITSALPYVNNVPHLGNLIGSTLSADVFARYCRGRGLNTVYVCGTDEYGTTTETKALTEGVTPRELCDRYHSLHADIYKWFNINFDVFGRTTTELQTEITQSIFLKLKANDLLEEKTTLQCYCVQHQGFLADRFIEGKCPHCSFADARGDQCDACGQLLDPLDLESPRCKVDGTTPIVRETKHMFFQLQSIQSDIDEHFRRASAGNSWSATARDITSAWLRQGLQPRSITRDLKWGVPVPLKGYEDKVIYPWFDACIGYVSITAKYTKDWEKWWRDPDNVDLYQFIGKDNTVYHSVIFPGTQIGTQDTWTKVKYLSATEYLTYEGGKFSKSRGIGVFGDSAAQTGVKADIWRYYLLAHRPETSDSEFNWDSFVNANNSNLLKNLGNLVNRVVKFTNSKHFNSVVPDPGDYKSAAMDVLEEDVNVLLAQYNSELSSVKLRAGLATVMQISSRGNSFLTSSGLDNKLAESDLQKCAKVIHSALNLIHLLAALLEPYMPETASAINKQLNAKSLSIPDRWATDTMRSGHTIGKAEYLFTLINPEKASLWRNAFGSDEAGKLKQEELHRKARGKANLRAGRELQVDRRAEQS